MCTALTETEDQPVAVLVHGGSGSRKQAQYVDVAERLGRNGNLVFVPSYKPGNPAQVFSPDGIGIRERLETIECAIRFARARAAEYGGDPGRITVIGQSAGGFFGGLIAFLDGSLDSVWEGFEGISVAPPSQMKCVEDTSSASVQGLVGFNGAHFVYETVNLTPEFKSVVNIESYVGVNPTLVVRFILGSADSQTPAWHVDRVNTFATTLATEGYDAAAITVEAGHSFDTQGTGWSPTLATLLEVIGHGG